MRRLAAFLKGNLYFALVSRILIIYIFYFLCRIIFYIYNYDHFKDLDLSEMPDVFRGGLIFDTSAIVYTNMLYIFLFLLPFNFRYKKSYQTTLMILFFITNGIALAANMADIPYYEFVLQRTSMEVFSQFSNEENMGRLMFRFFIDYWYLMLTWILFISGMIYLYQRIKISAPEIRSRFQHYLSGSLIFFSGIILIIGGARGGFKPFVQPVNMSNAWAYVRNTDDVALVLNTPFTLMHSAGKRGFERINYFSDENELEGIYSPLHKAVNQPPRKDNVVILVIESLNREFIGSLNRDLEGGTYKGFTPFLDSLLTMSRVYMHSYANGRKSIDLLPSLFCSLPRIGLPYVLNTSYYRNKLNSLPASLKEMGYHTSFFHGAPNGSFAFEAFTHMLGVDKYYGMNEYNNDKDYDGSWGIWDEEFMQYFAHSLNSFTPPFFSTLFTISSHHPFTVPEKHRDRFIKTDFPLEQTVQYTDYSLQRFFKTASEMPWYKNTLFIITADHVSKNQRPEFMNEIGYFSIPIIFYHPGEGFTGVDIITNAQQTDIMPTVLNYLGYNKDYIAFGKDLFNPEGRNFAFNYLNDTYRLFLDDYLLVFNGTETHALYRIINYRQLSRNIMGESPAVKADMERYSKAFIQQYINRMIDNRLTTGK